MPFERGEVHMKNRSVCADGRSARIGVVGGLRQGLRQRHDALPACGPDARWAPVRQLDEGKGVTPTAQNPGYLLTKRDIQEHHCLLAL